MAHKFSSNFAVNIPRVHSIHQQVKTRQGEKTEAVLTAIQMIKTVKLHSSGLIGKESHPDMQKIRIIGYFFENRLHWQSEVRLLLFIACTCV